MSLRAKTLHDRIATNKRRASNKRHTLKSAAPFSIHIEIRSPSNKRLTSNKRHTSKYDAY